MTDKVDKAFASSAMVSPRCLRMANKSGVSSALLVYVLIIDAHKTKKSHPGTLINGKRGEIGRCKDTN